MSLTAMNPTCQALFWSLDTSQVFYASPQCQEEGASAVSMVHKESWKTKILSALLRVMGLPIARPR